VTQRIRVLIADDSPTVCNVLQAVLSEDPQIEVVGCAYDGLQALTKAKHLRPVVEKVITKAVKGGVYRQRDVVAFIRDKDMANKLFAEIGPRYADRPGGYTRILKLGNRQGDNAPMARIELV